MVGLVATCSQNAGCVSTLLESGCDTDSLPPSDPCYRKSCCDMVPVAVDAGATDGGDAGEAGPTIMRMCGACNG